MNSRLAWSTQSLPDQLGGGERGKYKGNPIGLRVPSLRGGSLESHVRAWADP